MNTGYLQTNPLDETASDCLHELATAKPRACVSSRNKCMLSRALLKMCTIVHKGVPWKPLIYLPKKWGTHKSFPVYFALILSSAYYVYSILCRKLRLSYLPRTVYVHSLSTSLLCTKYCYNHSNKTTPTTTHHMYACIFQQQQS